MGKVLSIYFPRWPVQLAKREHQRTIGASGRHDPSRAVSSEYAIVFVAGEQGRQWVVCACERAAFRGVRVGMSLAHGKALLQGLRVSQRPFAPLEDTQKLHRLARWMQRFSPVVAADEPDGLLMELSGCEHLHGGDKPMVAHMDSALTQLGLQARLALAPSVGCACAAARFAPDRINVVPAERIREFLAPLPVAGLRIDPLFVEALNEVGIERIGSLFDLPRQELARRFGPDLLRRLDQATGDAVETITPIRSAAPIEVTRVFEGAVTGLEAVLITARELLFALILQLEERCRGVRTLEVTLDRLAAESVRCSVALTYPSRNVQHLWTLLRPNIERINLGYGVESVTLRAARHGKLSHHQEFFYPEVEEDRGSDAVLGEFLDRLIDRFGRHNVCRMTPVETHVPERAFPLQPWSGSTGKKQVASRTGDALASAAHGDRPSQLFQVPEPAQVIFLVPDGPPSWVRWRAMECAVQHASAPERLALPWWEPGRSIGPDAARDYYYVQDDQGRLLWLFRDLATNGWFVHGVWA